MADHAAHAHKIRLNLAANHKRGTRTVHGDSDTDTLTMQGAYGSSYAILN